MCEDCDVEFFLVLPRLLCLKFLIVPEKQELLRSLLPTRFHEGNASGSFEPSPDLEGLISQFKHAQRALLASPAPSSSVSLPAARPAWEPFVRAAVAGFGAGGGELTPARLADVEKRRLVEDFMRELEIWSIEVQRNCPEDWNQCSAVLVRCLSGGEPRQQNRHTEPFCV